MSLRPEPIGEIPAETARVARAAFPKDSYDLPRFAIDWDGERVTCPQGKTSVSWRRETVGGGGGTRICAQSSRSDCGPCAARAHCASATAARRSVHFHPRESMRR